jgi:signal transduction histidine kinase
MIFETVTEQGQIEQRLPTPILIIDDEAAVLEALKEFLDDEGFQVHLAGNGKEGLRVFHEVKPDVVATDLRMPGLAGMDVIRQIKTANPNALVIVVTGYGSMETAVAAMRLNVFDFISKPIDLDEFREILERARHNLAGNRRSEQEVEAQKEQLSLARMCLSEYRERLSEVESLALTGQHLAGILHNLISPLSYIMGHAQILRMLHPEVERLEKIEAQAVRMEKIIGTILTKLKHSQLRQVESVQLNEILKEEVYFLEAYPFFKYEVSTRLDLAPELPELVGMAADFSQLFGNILRNAVEALRGQPRRELRVISLYDDSDVYISIDDSGPGIPEHLHERIFEPFYSSKTDSVGISGGFGTGLGLYSCRQLANKYGGSIEVISKQGTGTRFLTRIPRVN